MTDKAPNMPIEVAQAYQRHGSKVRAVLLQLRELVFEAAEADERIGPITETLKWGEPSYLTDKTKSGSTIRLGMSKLNEGPAVFVNCNTKLISQFEQHYADTLDLRGKRAVLIDAINDDNRDAIKHCLAMALTYHANKKG